MFFPGWEFLEFTTEGLKLDPCRIENNLKERPHAFDQVVATGGDPSIRLIPPGILWSHCVLISRYYLSLVQTVDFLLPLCPLGVE